MNNILKPNETMEDVIRILESSFEAISGIAPVAYWYENLNEDGRIRDIHFSERMRSMLGYASLREFPDELDSFVDHVHPDDVMGVLDNAIAAGTGKIDRYDARYRIRRADGTYMWCNATGQVVKDHAGKTVGMYGAFIDISAEVELREKSKEEGEKLIEDLLKDYNLVYRVDLSDGSFKMLKIDRGIIGEGLKFDDFMQARRFFIEEVAYEPDRALLRRELDFDAIRSRLKTESSYSVEYRAVIGGVAIWHEMEISSLGGDEVAISFVMKDAEVLNRHIARVLMDNLDAVYVVNLNTDQMKVLKASGIMRNKPAVVAYSKMVREFASGLSAEAREYFEAAADVAYEKRALKADGKTEFFYQSPYYGEGPVWLKCETHVLTWANGEPETAVIGISKADALQGEKIELNERLRIALDDVTEEKNRFAAAADLVNSANWSFMLDQNDEIVGAELYGEPAEILGIDLENDPRIWEESIHPDDREKTLKAFNDAVGDSDGKTPYDVVYRMRDRDGNYLWFRSAGRFIDRGEGEREFFGILININDRVEEELKRQHQLEEALTFTNFFLDTFVSAYYVDLEALTCQTYKRTAELEQAYPIVTNYFDSISEYIERDVHPDDRATLLEIVQPETMRERLKEDPEFTHVFRDVSGGVEKTYRMQVIRGAEENHAAFGFIDISEEIGEQNRRLREVEESERLIESVASAYNVAYKVNMADDSFQLLRMNSAFVERSKMAEAKTFSEIKASLAETILHPNERERIIRELDYATIRGNLEERQSYDVEYRVLLNGATAWHMLNVTKIDENEFAIGFAERDLEITKRRLEEKRFDEYFSLLVVDMDTETLRVLKNENWYRPAPIGASEPYGPAIREFAACLPEEPRAFFLQLSDLDYVRRELAVDDKRTYSYKSAHLETDKWVDVTTYVILRHEDGTPAMFTLGFGVVDALATVREELRQRLENALAEAQAANRTVTEQSIITGYFLEPYSSAYYVGLDDLSCRIYRRTEEMAEKYPIRTSFLDALNDYIDSEVIPEDRAALKKRIRPDYMRKRLAEQKEYSHTFRTVSDGEEKTFFLNVIRGADEDHAAFGFRDITEEVNEQNRRVREAEASAKLIESVASVYRFAFTVDMATDAFKVIRIDREVKKRLQTEWIDRYCDAVEPLLTMLHPSDRARMEKELDFATIREKLKDRISYNVEYRIISNGATFWHEMNVTHISGDLVAMGFGEKDIEITKRHLEENRFSEYFAMYEVDVDRGMVKIVVDSPYYGIARAGMAQPYSATMKAFAESLDGEAREFFLRLSDIEFAKKELEGEGKHTYTYRSGNVDDKWIDCSSYVTYRHEDGSPAMFTLGFSYIDPHGAERQELQSKIAEQNARLEEQLALTDGLSRDYHTVWLLEGSGKHNMHLYRSTGVKTIKSAVQLGLDENCYDTGIVKYVMNYVYEDDRERVLEQTKFETVERETPEVGTYVVSYRRYNKDHTSYDYHQMCYAKAVSDSGAVNYIFAYRDADQMLREQIAQQEMLEKALTEAQAASRAKSDFLFNMSHDVRTPMNAILGFTNMAEKHIDDKEKVVDCLEKTKQSGNLLLALINGVLDMSRIESGSAELNEQAGDVLLSFANIESTLREEAAAKDVALSFEFGGIADRYVYADFTRCLRIFTNLITNGIKYSRAGGWVKVRCEQAAPAENGRASFRYTVEDNGIGMSEEFQQHMFEAFTREYNSTVSGIQGTGLGLSVCKTFVEYLGGTIDCESALGKGTKFTVILPFRVQEGKEFTDPARGILVSAEDGTAAPAIDFRGKKTLLVEDNELNREIALDILEDEGLVVEEAEDGAVAVELLREKGPDYYDFILMDIQMPVMNGYEATKAIRAMYPEAKLPIVALSANAFAEDRAASLAAGMDDHVAKPINVNVLFSALAKFL